MDRTWGESLSGLNSRWLCLSFRHSISGFPPSSCGGGSLMTFASWPEALPGEKKNKLASRSNDNRVMVVFDLIGASQTINSTIKSGLFKVFYWTCLAC